MSTFELVVEQVRAVAGADFAFVLTRRGRLVTRDAPRDMPESGRDAIVDAARALGRGEVGELTMPRQELVPYGGAAPVDVHLGVAADQAILCVVMSSWVGKAMVSQALKDGVAKIEAVIAASGREPMRRRKSQLPPPMDKAIDTATVGLVTASGATTHAARSLERPPVIQRAPSRPPPRPRTGSLPEISVTTAELGRESLAALDRELKAGRAPSAPQITLGEATLGRESLAAIDSEIAGRPRASSAPLITVGEGALGRESLEAIDSELRGKRKGSAPVITLGEAPLGRESLAAIEREDDERPSGVRLSRRTPVTSMPDTLHIELEDLEELDIRATPNPDSPRATRPWVELPEDTKRAVDAESLGRKLTPPRVTLKLEDADTDVFEAARVDPAAPPPVPAVKRRK